MVQHALGAAERREPIRRDRDAWSRGRAQYAPLPLRTTPTVRSMIWMSMLNDHVST
jgi:hypothetical protein